MNIGAGIGIGFKEPRGGLAFEYEQSSGCQNGSDITPIISTPGGTFTVVPAGLIFADTGTGTSSTGVIDLSASTPGNYVITYSIGPTTDTFTVKATDNASFSYSASGYCEYSSDPVPTITGLAGGVFSGSAGLVINSVDGEVNLDLSGPGNYSVTYTTTGECPNASTIPLEVFARPNASLSGESGFCVGSTAQLDAVGSNGTAPYTFAWYLDGISTGDTGSSINVSAPGSYSVFATDANGCTSLVSNSFSVQQFASPTVTITTAPGTTICTGDTATLTAEANGGAEPYTYLWSNSDTTQAISVAPTTTTTYTVTVTDDNGCTGTASQEITPSTNATAIASINNDAAMSFNGTDQYIEASGVTSLNGLSTMSFSLWVKAASGAQADNYSTILTIADSTTNQGQIIFSQADTANNFNFYVRTSSGYGTPATTGTGFFNGNWRHVAGTYDGANLKLYLDGTQVSSVSRTGNLITATGELYLSRSYNSLQNFFNGELDEVAVWDSALSSCDIKGIYEGSIGSNAGKAANLLDANTTIPAPVYWNRMGDS
ncbi:LamG domain-containing protein [bacterium]|nr:LamG domain-containing protein [bacterium]